MWKHADCRADIGERGPSPIPAQVARPKTPTKPLDRLPKLNYTILKDTALKKKLAELGIPNWGNKALLARRHSEWVNLWNANCDSSRPRTKRELLHELDTWERSQGGLASNMVGGVNGGSSVMKKEFDGSAWAANHNEDFQRLIAKARQKPKSPSASTDANPNSQPIPQADVGADRQSPSYDSIENRNSAEGQRHPGSKIASASAEEQAKWAYTPRPNSTEKSVIDIESEMTEVSTNESIPFEQSRDATDSVPHFRRPCPLARGSIAGRPRDM